MGKTKIADSIIIRVGGGIREVPRAPVLFAENQGAMHHQPGFEQTEDVHPFGIEEEENQEFGPDKILS